MAEPFVMPPDTLLVEEDGIVTGIDRAFYEEHKDEHEWTIVAEGDEPTDVTEPEGEPVEATLDE